ncbi:hypothetical protein BZL30_6695 [Mycobacterium kansasii]|uniref:Uncharacterized protein n=1 Tax=Mycobacterium kansasii TaxID=1768 RepID=A0A1V3WTB1_MYCKA|nr:hypothetical protein BZL30_6695 [Mycobacterium kansasii]
MAILDRLGVAQLVGRAGFGDIGEGRRGGQQGCSGDDDNGQPRQPPGGAAPRCRQGWFLIAASFAMALPRSGQ